MPDRAPRLGDVIDDYCPRCRLLLNHDVTSLFADEVAKVTCRTGDVYARWVYQAPDLFARVQRGDRLKLSFWYRASATLGDALVQISHDAAPGWEQYPLKRLRATGDAWVR